MEGKGEEVLQETEQKYQEMDKGGKNTVRKNYRTNSKLLT